MRTRQVQKVARDAEMRRRVGEAKTEESGSEASDGSRKVQTFATYGQIPAFGLYMSLRHPSLIACGSLSGSARHELASAANSWISHLWCQRAYFRTLSHFTSVDVLAVSRHIVGVRAPSAEPQTTS